MADVCEEVQLQGHIIDSLLLPKVLDVILTHGGTYVIKDIKIGQRGSDPSHAKIEVKAPTAERLNEILGVIHDHGAVPVHMADCATVAADLDGAYDLVLANIVAAVLQKLAPELAAHLAPGATLIVAGIIAAEEAETVGAFTAEGLRAIDREQAGDWVALQLTA